MKKIIFSHFYNEEYLLPWWLNHHKKYFDHGVMINYASTDNSIDIIKRICPTWDIVDSRNLHFTAYDVDREVEYYMNFYDNSVWKIALNTTEFLIGDYTWLNSNNGNLLIPCLYFVDDTPNRDSNTLSYDVPLWEVLKTGLDYPLTIDFRGSRLMHTENVIYPTLGRHFKRLVNCQNFVIFNYGFAPMTTEFKNRKLQIQHKIPDSDRLCGNGGNHTNGVHGLTEDSLVELYKCYLPSSKQWGYDSCNHVRYSFDLSDRMNGYLNML